MHVVKDNSFNPPTQWSSISYTLAEIDRAAVRFVNENDASKDLNAPDAMKLRLFLGMFLVHLAKREQGEVSDGKSSA